MNSKHQLRRETLIQAPAEQVWSVIADSTLLPEWVPAVSEVEVEAGDSETAGTRRTCQVSLGGREGTMVERCVDMVPNESAAYVVEDDTLGFSRMFADYGFVLSLEPIDSEQTRVRCDTYYTRATSSPGS